MIGFAIFGAVWIVVFFVLMTQIQTEKLNFKDKPEFITPFYDNVYHLSFVLPFKWFVEDDNNLTKKGLLMQEQLRITGNDKMFSVRSFMAYKVVLLIASLALGGFIILLMHNMGFITGFLLDLDSAKEKSTGGLNPKTIILVLSACMIIPLMPGLKLKSQAKRALVTNTKDLPMIQMFTILMLRSNKTVSEILFALSKLNTSHRDVFERGYRIYLRNKQEGMAYLRSNFTHDRFIEMFNLLEDIAEYAREECIQIMESNRKSLVDDINSIKRKNDLSRLVYSQASMMVPFAAILLLGAAPVIIMGVSIMGGSLMGGNFGNL